MELRRPSLEYDTNELTQQHISNHYSLERKFVDSNTMKPIESNRQQASQVAPKEDTRES